MATGPGHRHPFAQPLLGQRQVLEGLSHGAKRSAVRSSGWLGVPETPGQLVGLGQDLIDGSGHRHHLMHFGRAGRTAWTITATPSMATTKPASISEPARPVP